MPLLAGVQAELLNLRGTVAVRGFESRDKLHDLRELDGIIPLTELLEQSGKDNGVELVSVVAISGSSDI
jgi:hypothetical protein